MISKDLDRRLRIIESGYGREHGWLLEHRGACIAVLSDPKTADMFWVSYLIEPTSDDPKVREMLRSGQFWDACDFAFRNSGFPDEVVHGAFGGTGRLEGEVMMRALYIHVKEPTIWESLLCFRRLRRARRMQTSEG